MRNVQYMVIVNYIKQTIIAIWHHKKEKSYQNAVLRKDFYRNYNSICDEWLKFGYQNRGEKDFFCIWKNVAKS